MIGKVLQYIDLLKKVNIVQFFYLNYMCKNVIRIDKSKVIPYKNTVIDIAQNSRIYLGGGDLEIGCDSFRKSKEETRVRLRENAVWSSLGGCKISYGSTLEILEEAILDCKYFTMNSNSTMIVAERITLGNDVMIGRNVVIYDSDHHQILNKDSQVVNRPAPVIIGNHVWLATNVLVLKGVTIEEGSIVGANVTVKSNVSESVILNTEYQTYEKKNDGTWDRKSPRFFGEAL